MCAGGVGAPTGGSDLGIGAPNNLAFGIASTLGSVTIACAANPASRCRIPTPINELLLHHDRQTEDHRAASRNKHQAPERTAVPQRTQ